MNRPGCPGEPTMAFRLIRNTSRSRTARATDRAMANHSSSWTSTPQPHGRRTERRQRFSTFLAALACRRRDAPRLGTPEDDLVAAVRALVPVGAARLATLPADVTPEPGGQTSVALRFPVPTPVRPGLYLEVALDRECGLDAWDRQLLGDAARVFGLMLGPGREAVAGPDGRSPPTVRHRSSGRVTACSVCAGRSSGSLPPTSPC